MRHADNSGNFQQRVGLEEIKTTADMGNENKSDCIGFELGAGHDGFVGGVVRGSLAAAKRVKRDGQSTLRRASTPIPPAGPLKPCHLGQHENVLRPRLAGLSDDPTWV